MNLLLTFSTVRQSTPVFDKRDDLKIVTVDVLSGVAEAGCVRGSRLVTCEPSFILVFDVPVTK